MQLILFILAALFVDGLFRMHRACKAKRAARIRLMLAACIAARKKGHQ